MGVFIQDIHQASIDYLTSWTSALWIKVFNEEMQTLLDKTGERIGGFAVVNRKCEIIVNEDPTIPPNKQRIKLYLIQRHENGRGLFQLLIIPCYKPEFDDLEIADSMTQACIKHCAVDQMVKNWFELYRNLDLY